MQFIVDVCTYVANALRKSLSALMSIPGLVLSGVTGFVTFVLSLFTDWDYTTRIVDQIDGVSAVMAEQFGVLRSSSSPVLDILVSFLAVDTFVECMVMLVAATIALVVSTLLTFGVAVVGLAVGILSIRGVLKLIRVFSGGFVDP